MSVPSFTPAALAAYREMANQDSASDYVVCGFKEGGLVMDVAETGSGGLRAVVSCLQHKFEQAVAVAIFRCTAVDDRGNTVSYRTKLVHVIYSGPKMPVMQRAKIGAYNKAFKDPFSVNLALQTNDAAGDLTEKAIEKALRASGGAHQPSHFDFTNKSVPAAGSGSDKARSMQTFSGSAPPPPLTTTTTTPQRMTSPEGLSSPIAGSGGGKGFDDPHASVGAPTPKAEGTFGLFERHAAAFDAKDVDALLVDYAAADCKLICTDAASGRTEILVGAEEVAAFYHRLLAATAEAELKQEHLEVMPEEDVIVLHLSSKAGFIVDTFRVEHGKIVFQTVVTSVFAAAHASVADDWEHVDAEEGKPLPVKSAEEHAAEAEAFPPPALGEDSEGLPLQVKSAEEHAAEAEAFPPPALGEDSEGLPLQVKSAEEHAAEAEAFPPPALGEDSEGLPLPVKSAEEHAAERDAFDEPSLAAPRRFFGFQMNETDTVNDFVASGADVNAEILSSADGVESSASQWKPPLHWAARLQSRPCVELLLSSGADKSVRDKFANQTAFDLARAENASGDILHLLQPESDASPLICVLPGRGYCATAAVMALAEDAGGCRVRVVVRDADKQAEVEAMVAGASHVHVVLGDLSDYDSLVGALRGADRVLVSPPSAPDREHLADAAIKAAKAAGVKHLVLISVFGCDRDETVDVWAEFTRIEEAARFTDIPLTLMRAADFMENYLSLLPAIAAYKSFAGNQGDGAVASVSAADVGAACAKVVREGPAAHGGKTYNLTGPEAFSRPQVAALLSELLGDTVEYNDMDAQAHFALLQGYGVPDFVCKIISDLHETYKAGILADVSPDLQGLLGADQVTTLRDFFVANAHLLIVEHEGADDAE